MEGATTTRYGQFINGEEAPGADGTHRPVLDPANNRPFAEVAEGTAEDARRAMEVAEKAFRESPWAGGDGSQRVKVLLKLAQSLEAELDRFAELESRNVGKTLREAKGDIQFVVRTLEYIAGLADKLEGETIPVPGGRLDYTIREPLGVTVHIAPWNFPLVLSVRSVAPALAAGNAVVLKPASLTPLSALAFARLARTAGVPPGILNVVVGSGRAVGETLVSDPRTRAVSFTGSVEVGQRISELAAARHIPTTLELGGKGPVIVFADADLDRAAKGVIWGIFGNAGQMCWAGSRLLVHASIREPFVAKVKALAEKLKVGPGLEAGVEMGPLVSPEQLDRVVGFVEEARRDGGTVVTGGARLTDAARAPGNFLAPTIVEGLPPEHRIVREEVFGPVLSVLPFTSNDEAVRLANGTDFGLLATMWTRDLATAHSVARSLECGMVGINDPPLTFPQSPFAGAKSSGSGFEQGSRVVEAYTRRKNILVNLGAPRAG
ncbi:MAG: aldehyde dehydrogenase family protein [Thermoplasmata archaeon]|nr:aldehyde dehydrogenase family protein [Thermoplasmata archaeon]